jgi:hypothetical protein
MYSKQKRTLEGLRFIRRDRRLELGEKEMKNLLGNLGSQD